MSVQKKSKSAKKSSKAVAKKGKIVVKAKNGVRRLDYVNDVLPYIAKEFKALPDPKDRPRGFASGMYDKLAKRFGITRNTADQYYWKAVWKHPKELRLSSRK